MGNCCGSEKDQSSMRDTTFPVKRYKTSSKSQKRQTSLDKKLKMRKAKSLNQADLKTNAFYSESEPRTADSVSKKYRKSGSGLKYQSSKGLSRLSTDVAARDDDFKDINMKDGKCEENLLAAMQGLK